MHPVAQRLPVHATGLRRHQPRMTISHHRNSQNAPRLFGVSRPRRPPARNCEILKSWWVISIADMLPAPQINDICIESQLRRFGNPRTSQVLRRLVLHHPIPSCV